MTSPVDLRPDHLEIVQDILRKHLPGDFKVWVLGSRANWTPKDSSDLDLALEGEGGLSYRLLRTMQDAFEDSNIPNPVDVVDFNRIGDTLLIGYAAVVPERLMGLFSHHLYRIQRNEPTHLTPDYICHLLHSPGMHQVVSNYATGTTVNNMLLVDFLGIPLIAMPQPEVLTAFDSLARSVRKQREKLIEDSKALDALHGVLLPKLVSGEVLVRCSEVPEGNDA